MSYIKPVTGIGCIVAAIGACAAIAVFVLRVFGPSEVRPVSYAEMPIKSSLGVTDVLPEVKPCSQKINVGPRETLSGQFDAYLACAWKYMPTGKGSLETERQRLIALVRDASPYADLDHLPPSTTIQLIGSYGHESVDLRYSGIQQSAMG